MSINSIRFFTFISYFLGMLFFSINSCANPTPQPLPSFKHFSDYTNIKPTEGSNPAWFRAHYWAKQKIVDRKPDPDYKNNKWKLVMRRGLFLAEVDKAMSEMY